MGKPKPLIWRANGILWVIAMVGFGFGPYTESLNQFWVVCGIVCIFIFLICIFIFLRQGCPVGAPMKTRTPSAARRGLLVVVWGWVGLCISLAALGETKSGTIVVVGFSKEKIVVAADSRVHYSVSGKIRDDECKIVAVKENLLFVPIGRTGNQYAISSLDWDATREALKATSAERMDSIQDISDRWGESMVRLWDRDLTFNHEATLRSLDGNIFTLGLFLGIEKNKLSAVVVKVFYDGAAARSVPLYPDLGESMDFSAFGQIRTAGELKAGQTPFAKSEAAGWSARLTKIPRRDRDVRKAIRWAQLTISHEPTESYVGGPIDAVELSSTGVRWVQRKKLCSTSPAKSRPI
jgi:hypothetical protein